MVVRGELTSALQSEVKVLVEDLRARADSVDEVRDLVHAEWQQATDAGRTALDEDSWREGLLAQVAVSWVLGCVFIRFCEDNGLVTQPMLSGRGEWRRWAADAQVQFFREFPEAGERAYLEFVFGEASELPGLGEVFGSHNPLWQFGPSDDACRELIAIWRATDPESGELVWDFADESWDTRFLGDLYQDLSEHAKKTFALLQTPDFVESFILDRTLDPAIEEFGLDGGGSGFRMIDPACGSGHFLLGAFERLANRWLEKDPAAGRRAAAARALESVFGVDLNPFAASIARFRLLVAALRFAEVKTLVEAPNLQIQVAVGDSLLHGPAPGRLQGVLEVDEQQASATRHLYETEDREQVNRYLGQRYHAVVANPPYITPKDPAANQAYRDRYQSCSGKYSLSVPFMERLFDLGIRGAGDRRAGYVGQITSNSFMKREFGKKLIEVFFASQVDLTHVIDASGAFIPGHGTPTVILFGRNRGPIADRVRAVLGIRGEPSTPSDPATGRVWSSILELIDRPGSESEYVSSAHIERRTLAQHPWSLQGGSAGSLKERIESGMKPLVSIVDSIGIACFTLEDDFFIRPSASFTTRNVLPDSVRPMVEGDRVRDWSQAKHNEVVFPYDPVSLSRKSELPTDLSRLLWPGRTNLSSSKMFGAKTKVETGLAWFEYGRFTTSKLQTPLTIAFAFVATHNHFVLDRGGKVFNRSAPVIKLPADTTEDDHLQLLGLLNSSTACFWMKQVFHDKGNGGIGGGIASDEWERFYEFDGTKIKQFPLTSSSVLDLSSAIDHSAARLREVLPEGLFGRLLPTQALMESSRSQTADLRSQMVSLQEELDWRCMHLYGITETDLSIKPSEAVKLDRGQRAFEIALARRITAGDATSTMFERHHSAPITSIPTEWPDWYQQVVERRLDLIKSDQFVNLLERPEYKRRWNWDPWEDLAHQALRNWLLTRLEDTRYWDSAEPRSVAQLADIALGDVEFVQVAGLYLGRSEIGYVELIEELVVGEAAPFLAAWRYNDSGLRKRAAWERTWRLQRREDAGEKVGKIPVPPKYGSGDFASTTLWKLRGKLDVPKERFISYPGTERANDPTPVIGWAGWDHLEQAQALTSLYNHRRTNEGWTDEQLVPLLAGLAELAPWLRQWHNEIDPNIGQGLGDYYTDYLNAETQRIGATPDDLTAWRPPQKTTRRRKKANS